MKSKFIRTAPLLVLALFSVWVSACKKNDSTPAPVVPPIDLAAKVVGNYKMIVLGQNNPVGGPVFVSRTGTVVLTRQGTALDQVTFKVSITRNTLENGAPVALTSTEDKLITLKDAGKAVDLYQSSTKLGRWTSDTINVQDYGFTGPSIDSKTIDFAAVKN